jgi:hypothetical protein
MTPCSSVKSTDVLDEHVTFSFRAEEILSKLTQLAPCVLLSLFSTLKIEAVRYFETSLKYRSALRYYTSDLYENLISSIFNVPNCHQHFEMRNTQDCGIAVLS